MDWLNVKSVEELKKLGSFKDVCYAVKQECKGMINIKGKSWSDMYKSIEGFKELIEKMNIKEDKKQNESLYFNSLEAEYIFYLVELKEKERLSKLKATKKCYTNKKYARTWRNKIANIINPDKCSHVKAVKALAQLNKLYDEMVSDEKK